MKADIHPVYHETVIRCACGSEIPTGSTKKEIRGKSVPSATRFTPANRSWWIPRDASNDSSGSMKSIRRRKTREQRNRGEGSVGLGHIRCGEPNCRRFVLFGARLVFSSPVRVFDGPESGLCLSV